MKRSAFSVLGIIIINALALTLSGGVAAEGPSVRKKESIVLSKKMQELYKTLADLLTDVTSQSRFQDPKNKHRIESEATKLASLAHDLGKKGVMSSDPDPTLPMVAELLGQETSRAAVALKRGNRAYARSILRQIPGLCMACHTRNSTGPEFSKLPFEPTSKTLTPVERGEFYAATRQFDRAQQEFIGFIKDQKAPSASPFDWQRAVQNGLTIAVRVKQDPKQTEEIVQSVLDTKNAPAFFKEDAKVWKTTVEDWKSEGPRKAMTEEGLKAETIRLMAKAREAQKYPMDRTADVLYLRASAATHQLLQLGPEGKHFEEALLLAGISYEVLSPPNLGGLHDFYYEACIRRAPHTPTAALCFHRYEKSMFFGYTGSAGTDLPEDVQTKLSELRSLSEPLTPVLN